MRAPAVLIRTPYDNTLPFLVEKGRRLADHGYVVAIQDCRGRFDSDGSYEPFRAEGPDGFDTIEWLAAQPWCDGRVGMAGRSYAGWTQWTAALEASAHLGPSCHGRWRPICTAVSCGGGGAFNLGVLMTWGLTTSGRTMQEHRPARLDRGVPGPAAREAAATARQDVELWRVAGPPDSDDVLGRRPAGARVRPGRPGAGHGRLVRPVRRRQFTAWAELRASARPRAPADGSSSGPWPHALSESTRDRRAGLRTRGRSSTSTGLELRWFDRWLRASTNGVEHEAPVRLFVMGANEWRDEREWPLARTRLAGWLPPLGRRRGDARSATAR